MLENINKIRLSTRKGSIDYANVIDMNESSATPLLKLGIKNCTLTSIKDRYLILVGGNERKDCLLLYLIDGEVEFETGNGIIHAKPGYLIHYPMSIPRRLELVKGSRYTELAIHIGSDIFSPFKTSNVIVRKSEFMPQMLEAFRGYVNETTYRKQDFIKAASIYANLMTVCLSREMHIVNNPVKSPMDSAMEKLWDAIKLHPHEDWTVDKMASFVHSSSSNFFRMVKRQKGFSPIQYVADIRMEKAKLLIENGGYSLKDISEAVGYSSVYSFSNAFSRHVGVRPGAYRRNPAVAPK